MKIEGINIQKGTLEIINQQLELKDNGIYIIDGENGSGKTSFLKGLLLSRDFDVHFDSKNEEQLFFKEPRNICTYIAQTEQTYDVTVREYIDKCSGNADEKKLLKWFTVFKLDHQLLDMKFNKLSGGEKKRVALISGLCRNNKYIFIDEPTNHLDDSIVEIFCGVFQEYAKDHVVVLVTHDERLQFSSVKYIRFEKNLIKQDMEENKAASNAMQKITTSKKIEEQKYNLESNRLIKMFIRMPSALLFTYFTILLFVMLSFFLNLRYDMGYASEEDAYSQNTILAYVVDGEYGDLNDRYAKTQRLTISEELYERLIQCKDIADIENNIYIEDVVICDSSSFADTIQKIEMSSEEVIINPPKDIITCYSELFPDLINISGNLEYGRYPNDYKKETCINWDRAKEISLQQRCDIQDVIGKTLDIGNEKYCICGILQSDYRVVLVSYDREHSFGFTSVENYQSLTEDNFENLYIRTKPGKERDVLNYLISNYPGNNYISASFQYYWNHSYNKSFILREILPFVSIFTLISALILLIGKWTQLQAEMSCIIDYAWYYLDVTQIRKVYFISSGVLTIIALTVISAVNVFLLKFFYTYWIVLFASFFLAYTPSLCMVRMRLDKCGY